MSKHSFRIGGGKWAVKEDKILAYAEGDISGKFRAHELDFSRGDDIYATRVNKEGLIEKYRENRLVQSNSFDNASWTKVSSGDGDGTTVTSGQNGYDGTKDAWLVSKTKQEFGGVDQAVGGNTDNWQTFSVYAKAGSVNHVRLYAIGYAYFDLSGDGSVGAKSGEKAASITKIGDDGWFRLSLTVDADVTVVKINPAIADGDLGEDRVDDGDGTGSVYVQDAQLELGVIATSYLESGASTAKEGVSEDMPRIDYRKGDARLLLESTRTNLARLSEGTPLGGKNNVTLTKYYGVAPDGLKTSLKVTKTNDANDRIRIETTGGIDPLDTSIRYTISAFVKNIDCTGATHLAARMDDDTLTPYLYRQAFRWDGDHIYVYNGTDAANSGTRQAAFAEDYGNGWWRIGFTFLPNDTTASFELDIDRLDATKTTVSSIETWGWQFEKREGATSYIPSYGVKSTRNFDEIEMLVDQSTDGVIGNYNTTFYMEVENNGGTNNQLARFITLGNDLPLGSSQSGYQDPRVLLYADPELNKDTWELKLQYRANGSGSPADVYVNKTGFNYNEKVKILGRIDGTEMASFANGIKNGTAAITTQEDIEDIDFSNLASDQNYHISDIQIFPFSLTDLDCEILTTKTTFNSFADMSETLNYNS